jgi:acetyltransferase-like isoleucine patch superfamily enzyme
MRAALGVHPFAVKTRRLFWKRRRVAVTSDGTDATMTEHVSTARGDADESSQIAATAVVYPGTVLGAGCTIADGAVVGKQPSLSPRSSTKREQLPPAELGPGTIVSTGAIVFAGTTLGAHVIVGDQACIRERVRIGDEVVIGCGVLVENDSTIGALTRIQAHAYITNYSTLEEEVFIAPSVVTTNDNFMGRTEARHELMKGPTIRRGARVGGGAVLCPAIEIGSEAYVGAGTVVIRDVAARTVVVGNPARVLRDVSPEELLENQ